LKTKLLFLYTFLKKYIQKNPKRSIAMGILGLAFVFCLPSPLFQDPTCMVLEDNEGNLLGARIATDGQWRFPFERNVPEKYAKALIAFEDKRFYYHLGIDPISTTRAFLQNIKNQHVVSGGSTISMQVIRMARKNQGRTFLEKIIEMIMAFRLELSHHKSTILAYYASNAPFGGNVVGIEAASWRYFGKNPTLLSWAEAATLAVLPNSPSLIHPGRNQQKLLEKRNRLLKKLWEQGQIDQSTYELSIEETLPQEPQALPMLAPHLLERAYDEQFKNNKNSLTKLQTTIDASLQQKVTDIVINHHNRLKTNEINNISVVVIDVETNNILAYIGNAPNTGVANQEYVDCAKAPRSSGSIFKPILFALANQEGVLTPNSLISDIPMNFSGYKPQNYFETYDGVIPAKRALVRSLNVPFIHILQQYGIEKFHFNLKKLGLSTINQSANYYGLPLILGGAETTLCDITNIYAGFARTVNHFSETDSRYFPNDFRPLNYIFEKKYERPNRLRWTREAPMIDAGSLSLTLETMQNVERPNSAGEWEQFESGKRIAWKTGTSFGFRDAWAIGVTPKYAVGVWVGNADGEGRPELIGVQVAAPIMLDIFNSLPSNDWFSTAYDDLSPIAICRQSGYRASASCEIDTIFAAKNATKMVACPYHQIIHLDAQGQYQVTDACENPSSMQHRAWFVLPPVEEYYYKSKNPNYLAPPPYRTDCQGNSSDEKNPMQLIYPRFNAQIFVPKDLNGQLSKTVFQAAHREANATIFWHLDNQYLTSTKTFHNIELSPSAGNHLIILVDEKGNRVEQKFEIKVRN
jgi:penicillin-binding protein 1C